MTYRPGGENHPHRPQVFEKSIIWGGDCGWFFCLQILG